MKIEFSNIMTAFDPPAIGTRVTHLKEFLDALDEAVVKHDFAADRIPGQGFILMPEAVPFVSAGVGPRTLDPEDYVCRCHRGVVSAYLRRQRAAKVEGCAVVVYTKAAYLVDPDVLAEPAELARIEQSDADYVLVAILAFAGPKTVLPLYRFVANLAGGNLEALAWTADEIRAKAKEVVECENAWCTVAD
jgi:hypothetical protein